MHYISNLMRKADYYLEKKQYLKAAHYYQKTARKIKGKNQLIDEENRILYYSILHSLGRALYGAEKYKEALEVYTWISPIYPRFKQTLVEKMWAAFRAKDLRMTTGAIVSQYSGYFNHFIHPETFLIQVYLYKMLCRKDDLKLTLKRLERFRSSISGKKSILMEWAGANFETIPYLGLLQTSEIKGDKYLTEKMILKEKRNIRRWLIKQFKEARKQYRMAAKKAVAYTKIALTVTKREMPPVKQLPPADELLKSGLEAWPLDDAETWLDEVGLHQFIGKSQCTDQQS